ncbi:MAG: MBL fold metallo-hydrolase [Ruminococcaceae bacterium]|nr:MBL fold metallo-hydrolase [Oscillospiraceae bacterium]
MKKMISLLLIAALILVNGSVHLYAPVYAASSPEMNIYALYLTQNSGEKPSAEDEQELGDAVIVESGGEYLLMDTGNSFASNNLISFLNALGVKQMSIYISHLHPDHFRGMEKIRSETNIAVDKLYLPAKTIGTDYSTSDGGTLKNQWEKAAGYFENAEVVELKKGSTFSFGSVQAKVLGPVSSNKQSSFKNDTYGSKSGHYLNNQSLTTMLTCGSTKYLTTGDIESSYDQPNYKKLKLEEEKLVSTYGSALKADILKLPHHALSSSNSPAFINAVKAKYAFAMNSGYESPVKNSDGRTVSKAMTPAKRVQKYGLLYLVSNEKKALHINVKSNNIKLMRASVSGGKVSDSAAFAGSSYTGWVDLYGHTQKSNGYYTGKDHYYMKNGKFVTGVSKIGGKWYNFGSGVVSLQGVYKNGSYSGWNYINDNKKLLGYFNKPDSKGRASAAIGFAYVKNTSGKKCGFYFDKKNHGARFVPAKGDSNSKKKQWKLKKIGKYKYLFKVKSGAVFNLGGKKNKFMTFKGGKLRAFDKKGRMLTGRKKVNGKKYTFSKKTGFRKK